MTHPDRQLLAASPGGGSASKRPVDAAAADAGVNGSSKSPTEAAAHTRLDSGAPAPTSYLENRPHDRPLFHSPTGPGLQTRPTLEPRSGRFFGCPPRVRSIWLDAPARVILTGSRFGSI